MKSLPLFLILIGLSNYCFSQTDTLVRYDVHNNLFGTTVFDSVGVVYKLKPLKFNESDTIDNPQTPIAEYFDSDGVAQQVRIEKKKTTVEIEKGKPIYIKKYSGNGELKKVKEVKPK